MHCCLEEISFAARHKRLPGFGEGDGWGFLEKRLYPQIRCAARINL